MRHGRPLVADSSPFVSVAVGSPGFPRLVLQLPLALLRALGSRQESHLSRAPLGRPCTKKQDGTHEPGCKHIYETNTQTIFPEKNICRTLSHIVSSTSSHRLIYIFTSAHPHSHLYLCSPSYIYSQLYIYISAHLHILTSTSHICTSHLHLTSVPLIYISHLHLSLFLTFSLKAGGSTAGAPRNATLLSDTLVGHSCRCRKHLWDILAGHFGRTLLWGTLV